MNNKKFSIWYNGEKDFFKLLDKYKNNISTVYFAWDPKKFSSGRTFDTYDDSYLFNMYKLLKKCKYLWIGTILLLNTTSEWKLAWSKEMLNRIITYVKHLKLYWLTSISLTNLLYVPFIKKAISWIEIYSSVNCYLKTVEQAVYFKKIWVDILTVDRDINRDIKLIKKIRDITWLKIQVMLNEGCYTNCPYRCTHFDIIAHNVEMKNSFIHTYSCSKMLKENHKMIFRIPIIRPEDLKFIDEVCDYYKLVTRVTPTKDIELFLNAYINEEYNWNYLDLFDVPMHYEWKIIKYIDNNKLTKLNFFDTLKNCPWNCDICFNCNKFLS